MEISTFGSDFVTLRIASDMIISTIYKLRKFGIPTNRPGNIFCDDESVYRKSTFDENN